MGQKTSAYLKEIDEKLKHIRELVGQFETAHGKWQAKCDLCLKCSEAYRKVYSGNPKDPKLAELWKKQIEVRDQISDLLMAMAPIVVKIVTNINNLYANQLTPLRKYISEKKKTIKNPFKKKSVAKAEKAINEAFKEVGEVEKKIGEVKQILAETISGLKGLFH
jgi:predicted ATP-binding protein involved in virulence